MIEIDKNVLIPRVVASGRPPKYPWVDMQVGDSFLIPDKPITAASALACAAAKRLGVRFTCRTTPEGVRVWRIA